MKYDNSVNWMDASNEIEKALNADTNVKAFCFGLDAVQHRAWSAQCNERAPHLHLLVIFKKPVRGKEVFSKTFDRARVSSKRVLQIEKWISHIHTLIAESRVGAFRPKSSGTKYFSAVPHISDAEPAAKRLKPCTCNDTVSLDDDMLEA